MRRLSWLLAAVGCGWAAGCGGGSPESDSAEEQPLRTFVGQVAESAADPARWAACFSPANFPDAAGRERLRGMMTRLERVQIRGDAATAEVTFEVLQTGEQLGPLPWELERAEGRWRITQWEFPPADRGGRPE